jgi:hypothetical protein
MIRIDNVSFRVARRLAFRRNVNQQRAEILRDHLFDDVVIDVGIATVPLRLFVTVSCNRYQVHGPTIWQFSQTCRCFIGVDAAYFSS